MITTAGTLGERPGKVETPPFLIRASHGSEYFAGFRPPSPYWPRAMYLTPR
jgi:hypothetical protein